MFRSLIVASLVVSALSAHAETVAAAKKRPPAKSTNKPAAVAPVPPPPEVPPPVASPEQVTAASLVHAGDYGCELKQAMRVNLSSKYANYIDVDFGNVHYTARPVLSTTGAIRIEDLKGKYLLLQIAFKSMMLDVVTGRRVVDECVHEKQAAYKIATEAAQAAEAAAAAAAAAAPTPASAPAPDAAKP